MNPFSYGANNPKNSSSAWVAESIWDVENKTETTYRKWNYKNGTEIKQPKACATATLAGVLFASFSTVVALSSNCFDNLYLSLTDSDRDIFDPSTLVAASIATGGICVAGAVLLAISVFSRDIKPVDSEDLRLIYNRVKDDQKEFKTKKKEIKNEIKLLKEHESNYLKHGRLFDRLKKEKMQSKLNSEKAYKKALKQHSKECGFLLGYLKGMQKLLDKEVKHVFTMNKFDFDNARFELEQCSKNSGDRNRERETNLEGNYHKRMHQLKLESELFHNNIMKFAHAINSIEQHKLTDEIKQDLLNRIDFFKYKTPYGSALYDSCEEVNKYLDNIETKPKLGQFYQPGTLEMQLNAIRTDVKYYQTQLESLKKEYAHLDRYYNRAINDVDDSGQFDPQTFAQYLPA